MVKRWMAAVFLLCCLALAGCGGAGQGGGRDVKAVKEYLADRYGDQGFSVEKISGGLESAYLVTPEAYPEAAFTVQPGKSEESSGYRYHDDFAAQMLYGGAERLGLACEQGSEGYDVFITYENYASLEPLAERLEKLVTDCRDSRAFDEIRNSCLITVKPEAETDPWFPGYKIRIKTSYTYPEIKGFGMEAGELEPGRLAGELRLCHVYNAYNYTIPTDSGLFSREDMARYEAICTGATGTAHSDGAVTIYPLANQDDLWMSFGSVYQILLQEGMVTETAPDRFTASGNGMTIAFTRAFSAKGPSVSWEILEGEELLDISMWSFIVQSDDPRNAVCGLTDKSITYSTPEKLAEAKEAERLERLPFVEHSFALAAAQGESVSVGATKVTLLEWEPLEVLQGDGVAALHSDEDEVWCAVRLRVENEGSEEMYVFHLIFYGRDIELFGLAADRDGNFYQPVDVINLGLEDMYGQYLSSGETLEGKVYFKLPRERLADGGLALLLFCGQESAAFVLE